MGVFVYRRFARLENRATERRRARGPLSRVLGHRSQDICLSPDRVRSPAILPYFNRSRVIAMRSAVVLSFPKDGNKVPIYLQPTLGGNDDLRGFGVPLSRLPRGRTGVEHRWHASSNLDMALFADAGKVVPLKSEMDPTQVNYSGGIGFRFRVRSPSSAEPISPCRAKESASSGLSATLQTRSGNASSRPRSCDGLVRCSGRAVGAGPRFYPDDPLAGADTIAGRHRRARALSEILERLKNSRRPASAIPPTASSRRAASTRSAK